MNLLQGLPEGGKYETKIIISGEPKKLPLTSKKSLKAYVKDSPCFVLFVYITSFPRRIKDEPPR